MPNPAMAVKTSAAQLKQAIGASKPPAGAKPPVELELDGPDPHLLAHDHNILLRPDQTGLADQWLKGFASYKSWS